MKVQVGQQAPDFKLFNTDKKPVQLSEQKGKNVVLLFFPLAFTGVCTKELCATRDELSFYNEANAVVYGISIDSVFSLKKFKEEQNLNFDLLSDFNKEAAIAYDSLYDTFFLDMKGVTKRSAFVIDKHGTIQYAEILEDAGNVPDFSAIKNCLERIK